MTEKAVDTKTKLLCYRELKGLYCLKRGENTQKGTKGTLKVNDCSTERPLMTDAEKGDAVLSLWANFDKFGSLKDVAEAINMGIRSVQYWVEQSNKLSPKVKGLTKATSLTNEHRRFIAPEVGQTLSSTVLIATIQEHIKQVQRSGFLAGFRKAGET